MIVRVGRFIIFLRCWRGFSGIGVFMMVVVKDNRPFARIVRMETSVFVISLFASLSFLSSWLDVGQVLFTSCLVVLSLSPWSLSFEGLELKILSIEQTVPHKQLCALLGARQSRPCVFAASPTFVLEFVLASSLSTSLDPVSLPYFSWSPLGFFACSWAPWWVPKCFSM